MSIHKFLVYITHEKNYSSHTITAYKKDLEDFLKFIEVKEEHMDHATYEVIRSWIVQLVDKGISNRAINRKIASLKAYYKFLLRLGLIAATPLAKHRALKTTKKVEVPFSEIEMKKIISQIPFEDNFEGTRDRLIIELLYATGIRRAELVGLKMADILADNTAIKVLGKRNKERIVPLVTSIAPLLQVYLEQRAALEMIQSKDFIFLTKSGEKIYETLVYRTINRYFSMVSQKVKKSPHVLRHTFATHLLNKGADLNAVKELLGHSSLASTQIYVHSSIEELKKVHQSAHPRNKR